MIATPTQLAHIAIQAELLAVEARAAILTEEDAAELLRMVGNCLLFLAPAEPRRELSGVFIWNKPLHRS
jgi:hypothetical protein